MRTAPDLTRTAVLTGATSGIGPWIGRTAVLTGATSGIGPWIGRTAVLTGATSGIGPWIGRTAVLTGATSGIGRWIALGLAQAGLNLVIIARDPARAQATTAWIQAEIPAATIDTVIADLASIAQTTEAARQIAAAHPEIALLVNNAGLFRARRAITEEGRDRVLAVNHLAPAILMRELTPALIAAALIDGSPSRIVTVGSSTSDRARLNPNDLELTRGWTMVRAYGRSKLATMIQTFETARRLAPNSVVANVVHPGAVATSLVRTPGLIGLAWRLMRPFLRTEQQGADTPLHVALDTSFATTTGAYVKDRRPVPPNPTALDPALAARIWTLTEALTKPS